MKLLSNALLLLCLSQASISLGRSIVNPILPIYAASFGIRFMLVGLVMSSFGFTRIFLEIPGGMLTSRVKKRTLILYGGALYTLSHVIAGVAQSFLELMISRMIMGVGSAITLNASYVYLGEISPIGKRSRNIAFFQSTFSIAGIVGPTLGGLISELVDVRFIFFVAAALSGTSVFLGYLLPSQEDTGIERIQSRLNVSVLVKDVRIIALSMACFIMFLNFSSIQGTLMPLYGVDELTLTSTQIGLVLSLMSAGEMISLLLLMPQLERFSKRAQLLSMSLLICAISVFLIAFASDFVTFALFSMPLGIGLGLLGPTPFAMIIDYTSVETRGLAMGVLRTIGDLGIIFGPMIVGWFMDIGEPRLAFYLVSSILGMLALGTWSIFRAPKKA